MKKLSYLLGLFLVAGILFSSCSKDEDEPQDLTPSISFKGDAGYTSSDVTISAGGTILVGVVALPNSTSGKSLTNFKLILTSNNTPQTLVDSSFSASSFDANYNISFSTAGETRLSAKITDKDGQSKEIAFNITVNAVTPTVSTKLDIQMGSVNDTEYGSFYSTSTHTLYKKPDATNNQGAIDFVFFKGANTFNTIAATSTDHVKSVFDLTGAGWTTFNETKIEMTTVSTATFDAIGVIYAFPELTGSTYEVNELEVGNVLLFETVNGKRGYIKINDFDQKGDRMNIDVKVAN